MTNILDYDTVALDDAHSALVIIDQTRLPNELSILHLTTQEEIHDAIYLLKVRGAPAIGVAAAYGIYLAAKNIKTDNYKEFLAKFNEAKDYLASSRPTAVNLTWALERMKGIVEMNMVLGVERIKELLLDESRAIQQEDIDTCRQIGEYGLTLLKKGDGIITHCNAGQLATSKHGTATAPIYLGHERGYGFHVFCDETRPLLQGARLTAYELMSAGVDVTLMCDGMAASVMKKGLAQAVITGCDRVAANGDAANKIGTLPLAIAAKRFNVPFYICAPSSTIDLATRKGEDIVIEERKPEEVTEMWYRERMAPKNVKVFNPAFDVTDSDLITAIITERGILYPPYDKAIKNIM
ncbi:MAG: S-methyl-5-thioribose-1-phosphate isomerase [Schwartzia sp.]|nr:S-methyl-5-thioribose-1-phosphate isomerase [Schwartzia sp. (in: firmicutes)]